MARGQLVSIITLIDISATQYKDVWRLMTTSSKQFFLHIQLIIVIFVLK